MHKSNELSRSVWSTDGRYLMMTHAKFQNSRNASDIQIAKAVVRVYDGDPVVTGKDAIFYSFSELHSYDLLDELQNAERIGREFIDSLR